MNLKEVKTLVGGVPVYKDAKIGYELVHPNSLYPTAKYVMRENLSRVSRIRGEIKDRDIYTTAGVVEHDGHLIGNPIVEVINGRRIIVDGLHRVYDARRNNSGIMVAVVDGVLHDYPPIGEAVSWDDVVEVSEKPLHSRQLRDLRTGVSDVSSELVKLFRDFSILGSTGRRPSYGQAR